MKEDAVDHAMSLRWESWDEQKMERTEVVKGETERKIKLLEVEMEVSLLHELAYRSTGKQTW